MAADGVDERSPLLSAPRSGHVTPTAPPYLPESGPGVDGTEVQHAGKMPTLQKNGPQSLKFPHQPSPLDLRVTPALNKTPYARGAR
ncbi:uncharacterized protein RBU33_016293 isoform 3-T7 [Hipposideros larvatus]